MNCGREGANLPAAWPINQSSLWGERWDRRIMNTRNGGATQEQLCILSLTDYVTALPQLLSDSELSQLAGDVWRAGPRPLYEALRELNTGSPLSFVLPRYARLGREPMRDFLASMDGRVLR